VDSCGALAFCIGQRPQVVQSFFSCSCCPGGNSRKRLQVRCSRSCSPAGILSSADSGGAACPAASGGKIAEALPADHRTWSRRIRIELAVAVVVAQLPLLLGPWGDPATTSSIPCPSPAVVIPRCSAWLRSSPPSGARTGPGRQSLRLLSAATSTSSPVFGTVPGCHSSAARSGPVAIPRSGVRLGPGRCPWVALLITPLLVRRSFPFLAKTGAG